MLSESSRMIARCDLIVSRWLLTKTGSTSMAARARSVRTRSPHKSPRFQARKVAAARCGRATTPETRRRSRRSRIAAAVVPCGSADELQPRVAGRLRRPSAARFPG